MKYRFAALMAAACLAFAGQAGAADAKKHWTYEGNEGPQNWAKISKDFAKCESGAEQSPIDLSHPVNAQIGKLDIHWNKASQWTVVNNGHTIQASAADGGFITIDGKQYKLIQFHFHTPSEHSVNGKHTDMEVHLVHQAADGTLAVIGVLMQGKGKPGVFDEVMKAAPKGPGAGNVTVLNPLALLPGTAHYYRYEGSLTTPPCSETVVWTVLKQPLAVSDQAIAAFKALYPMDARPVQATHRRFVLAQ